MERADCGGRDAAGRNRRRRNHGPIPPPDRSKAIQNVRRDTGSCSHVCGDDPLGPSEAHRQWHQRLREGTLDDIGLAIAALCELGLPPHEGAAAEFGRALIIGIWLRSTIDPWEPHMDRPSRTLSAPDACPPCPACQSTKTMFTVKTDAGRYCRCADCGNVWHHEKVRSA
jgi:hypothetical protein